MSPFELLADFVARAAPDVLEQFFRDNPQLRHAPKSGKPEAIESGAKAKLAAKFASATDPE